jgi:hypothetical protein
MLQLPPQLAACLVDLSEYPIHSYCEIGTFNGVATCFVVAYLQRFNPAMRAVTVDIERQFTASVSVAELLPLSYHLGTSDDFRGQAFDLCFIDGDHTLPWVARDYNNVGRISRFCLFHDINCDYVAAYHGDGPRQFWAQLRIEEPAAEFREYTQHSTGQRVMGLGLRIRRARPRIGPPAR